MKLKGTHRWEATKFIFWGLVLSTALVAFWYSMVGNPIEQYKIMMRDVLVEGAVHDCIQEVVESDSGQGGAFQSCGYSYSVNGQKFGGYGSFPNETEDGDPVGIIYLPDDPSVHVEQVGAATGFFDWLLGKVFLGAFLLIVTAGAGCTMIWNGIKAFCRNAVVE